MIDLATTLQIGRLTRDHPGATWPEIVRLALAECDAELDRLEAIRAEAARRQEAIRRTGQPTGLPPLALDRTTVRGAESDGTTAGGPTGRPAWRQRRTRAGLTRFQSADARPSGGANPDAPDSEVLQ